MCIYHRLCAHLVQFDIAWEDRFRNFEKVHRLIDDAGVEKGDFVLLPEMFDTGFSVNTKVTADAKGETLAFLQELAKERRVFIQGGRTVHPAGDRKASNVATVISPAGVLLTEYSKVHLFPLGQEPEMLGPGNDLHIWKWDARSDDASLNVFPAICYDLRFPELFRAGLKMGAELIALGACWPEGRHTHWKALLVARAIENQAFVLGVNRTGKDPTLHYLGGTVAVNPKGEILGELHEEEGVLSVDIDPGEVRRRRRAFPAWHNTRMLDSLALTPAGS